MDPFHIIPECFVDTNLVSALLGGIGVNHQKSCNNVISLMKGKFRDDFAVGIIDDDKRKPQYLNECVLLAQSDHLRLLKHPQKDHYIIIVSPAAEAFIMSVAEVAGVSMTQYGLPAELNGLKRITKHIVSNKNNDLMHLFRDLSTVGEFDILRKVLGYLLEKGYSAESEELVALFR